MGFWVPLPNLKHQVFRSMIEKYIHVTSVSPNVFFISPENNITQIKAESLHVKSWDMKRNHWYGFSTMTWPSHKDTFAFKNIYEATKYY